MYWHTRILLFIIISSVAGSILYGFRSQLANLSIWSMISNSKLDKVEDKGGNDPGTANSGKSTTAGSAKVERHGIPPRFNEKLRIAQDLFGKEELLKARKVTEIILLDPKLEVYSEYWLQAADLLSQINTVFLFTDAPCPEKQNYIIQRGDSLIRIAQKFSTTVALIQRGNNLDETNPMIYPDQVFRIYIADWHIEVIKSRFLLLVYDGDKLVKVYKIGTGRQNRTPVGSFEIDLKDFEPDWWRPGKVVKFGDPENVLGTRWMSLKPIDGTSETLKGYGIHGTWEPQSIGTAASQGCVRMINENVEELFDIVPQRTRVVIVE